MRGCLPTPTKNPRAPALPPPPNLTTREASIRSHDRPLALDHYEPSMGTPTTHTHARGRARGPIPGHSRAAAAFRLPAACRARPPRRRCQHGILPHRGHSHGRWPPSLGLRGCAFHGCDRCTATSTTFLDELRCSQKFLTPPRAWCPCLLDADLCLRSDGDQFTSAGTLWRNPGPPDILWFVCPCP